MHYLPLIGDIVLIANIMKIKGFTLCINVVSCLPGCLKEMSEPDISEKEGTWLEQAFYIRDKLFVRQKHDDVISLLNT